MPRYPTAYRAGAQKYRGTPSFQGPLPRRAPDTTGGTGGKLPGEVAAPAGAGSGADFSPPQTGYDVPGGDQTGYSSVDQDVGYVAGLAEIGSEMAQNAPDLISMISAAEALIELGSRLWTWDPGGPYLPDWRVCNSFSCGSLGQVFTVQNWPNCTPPALYPPYCPVGNPYGAINTIFQSNWHHAMSGYYEPWPVRKNYMYHCWERTQSGPARDFATEGGIAPQYVGYAPAENPPFLKPLDPEPLPNEPMPAAEEAGGGDDNVVVGFTWPLGSGQSASRPNEKFDIYVRNGVLVRTAYKREKKGGFDTKITFLLKWGINFLSEVGDFGTALYYALPWDIRRRYGRSVTEQSKALYENFDKIDITQAVTNIILNQFQDMLIGRVASGNVQTRKDAGLYVTGQQALGALADMAAAVPQIVDPDYARAVLADPDATPTAKKAAQTFLDYDANAAYVEHLREYRHQYYGFGVGAEDRGAIELTGVRW